VLDNCNGGKWKEQRRCELGWEMGREQKPIYSWLKKWKESAWSRGWEMVRADNQTVEVGNGKEEKQ
jgi:hypothetical protein